MAQRNYFLKVEQLNPTDLFILFYDAQVLMADENFLWHREQLSDYMLENAELVLLETQAGAAVIAVNMRQDFSEILQAKINPLRSLLLSSNQNEFLLVGRASQLVDWYNTHRFCGSCGGPTSHHDQERALLCNTCSKHYFPRINPCVIMLVVKGTQMLLAQSSRIKTNFHSCLAGFIEIGETPEETVIREVKEEVNLTVDNVCYVKSQSWPFPSQLMLGFLADYKLGDIIPEPAEIAEARWYGIDNLPTVPSAEISVAGELIQHFIAQVKSGERS